MDIADSPCVTQRLPQAWKGTWRKVMLAMNVKEEETTGGKDGGGDKKKERDEKHSV